MKSSLNSDQKKEKEKEEEENIYLDNNAGSRLDGTDFFTFSLRTRGDAVRCKL